MHLLKDEILEELKQKPKLRKKIAKLLGCHVLTVSRWVDDNHPSLTCWTILDFLESELWIKKAQLIYKVKDDSDDE